MNWTGTTVLVAAAIALTGCAARGTQAPAQLDTRTEHCRSCQMTVSDASTAAQIVAPGEEPLFFDDLWCLGTWLERHPIPAGGMMYVADHRTRAWVAAGDGVFTRAPDVQTPMGSHLIAHASRDSLAQDGAATKGEPVSVKEILRAPRSPS